MLKNVVVPKKNWDPELYEILRHLQLQAQQAAGGLAAVGRGEKPDGSGDPLIDTGIFFLLAGRPDNQLGYGGTAASGTLTLSSTNNSSKGFIYFGYPTHFVAMDETQKFVGVNVAAPAAVLHLQSVTAGTTTLVPSADVALHGNPAVRWDGYRNAAGTLLGPPVYLGCNINDDDTTWSGTNDSGGPGVNTQGFTMSGTITPGRVWTCTVRLRTDSGTCSSLGNLEFRINDSAGNQFTGQGEGTGGTFAKDFTGLSTTWVTYTFTIDGTGTPSATGQPANSVEIGVAGVQLPTTHLYIRCTYIEISTGGASEIARWNNSSGTLLGKINSAGQVGIGTGSATLSAMATIIPSSSSTTGLLVKGAASQSARLLQLQNSSGSELGGFSSAGAMFFISGAASGKVWTSDSGGVGSWGDIDQARTWATLQTFKDTTFKVVDDGDSTKTLVFSLGGATAGADLTLVWSGAADRTITLPALTGLIPLTGDDPPAVAAGALGKVDLTTQTADIASTNLSNGAPAGFYLVTAVIECTTSDGAAGSLTFTLSWTDDGGAKTSAAARSLSLGVATTTFNVPIYVASGEISYATTHSGSYGSSVYALHIRVTYLG